MKLPWTSRALLEAAEKRAAAAEAATVAIQEQIAAVRQEANYRESIAESHVSALQEERKLLLDRIVQMTGQPPIFHPVPTSATPAAPESTLAGPATRASFDDVHRAAREAISTGKLNLVPREA